MHYNGLSAESASVSKPKGLLSALDQVEVYTIASTSSHTMAFYGFIINFFIIAERISVSIENCKSGCDRHSV